MDSFLWFYWQNYCMQTTIVERNMKSTIVVDSKPFSLRLGAWCALVERNKTSKEEVNLLGSLGRKKREKRKPSRS